MTEVSRASIRWEVWVTGSVSRWRGAWWSKVRWLQWRHTSGGGQVQQGSDQDGGTAKLKHPLVGALSSFNPPGVSVPLILVSRWSPYPSVQTCGLGCAGPLLRAFPLLSFTLRYLSLDVAPDITDMADSDSILDGCRCPKSPSDLALCTRVPPPPALVSLLYTPF